MGMAEFLFGKREEPKPSSQAPTTIEEIEGRFREGLDVTIQNGRSVAAKPVGKLTFRGRATIIQQRQTKSAPSSRR